MRWKLLPVCLALLLYFCATTAAAYDSYDALCDPSQRGVEAVKIAMLKENPSVTTWGYDLPYSYAYGLGVPRYVGHNYGMPTGTITEFPQLYPYGCADPWSVYGDPENAMLMNYGYSFPYHDGTISTWY